MLKKSVTISTLFFSLVLVAVVISQERRPLSVADVKELLRAGVSHRRVAELVEERGVNFEVTGEIREGLERAGADAGVIRAVLRAGQEFAKKRLEEERRLAVERQRVEEEKRKELEEEERRKAEEEPRRVKEEKNRLEEARRRSEEKKRRVEEAKRIQEEKIAEGGHRGRAEENRVTYHGFPLDLYLLIDYSLPTGGPAESNTCERVLRQVFSSLQRSSQSIYQVRLFFFADTLLPAGTFLSLAGLGDQVVNTLRRSTTRPNFVGEMDPHLNRTVTDFARVFADLRDQFAVYQAGWSSILIISNGIHDPNKKRNRCDKNFPTSVGEVNHLRREVESLPILPMLLAIPCGTFAQLPLYPFREVWKQIPQIRFVESLTPRPDDLPNTIDNALALLLPDISIFLKGNVAYGVGRLNWKAHIRSSQSRLIQLCVQRTYLNGPLYPKHEIWFLRDEAREDCSALWAIEAQTQKIEWITLHIKPTTLPTRGASGYITVRPSKS